MSTSGQSGTAQAEAKEWQAPSSIEETFAHLQGNKFASLNSDTAGARNERPLSVGSAEYQLYSLATPNGQKVGIAFEEFGVNYDAHTINIMNGDQFSKDFVAINPNSKIPAMKHGDVRVFESGAILLYLAEKYNKFIPQDLSKKAECYSWLMWQMGGLGPMTGQFGHFYKYAPRTNVDAINYGVSRYGMETRRLLSVADTHLKDKTWFLGDEYTIADMAIYPWAKGVQSGYGAENFLGVNEKRYPNLVKWFARMEERPAVQKGMLVCSMDTLKKP